MELIIPCAFLMLLCSCGSNKQETAPDADSTLYVRFGLIIDADRKLVDSSFVDLNRDGIEECILTIGMRDTKESTERGFDVLHVLEYSQKDYSWKSIFVDVVNNGQQVMFDDVTGNGAPEVLAKLNHGGDDSIFARGLHVYGIRSDSIFTLLFYESSGNPQFKDLDEDGVSEIIVSGQYRGQSSELEPYNYTEAVYAFNGMAYTIDNSRFSAYFSTEINSRLRSYARLKAAESGDIRAVFHIALELVLWKEVRGFAEEVAQFWTTENNYLKNLLREAQYEELLHLVNRMQQPYIQPLAEQGL